MFKRFNVFFIPMALMFLALSTFAQDSWIEQSSPSSSQVLKLQETSQTPAETLSYWDFESGWGNWWVDNGVWEVGHPTSSSPCSLSAHSGDSCAGTNLAGLYPNYSDTRLISPAVNLPSIGVGEELRLSFWHWFSFNRFQDLWGTWHVDSGQVEMQVYNYDSLFWGSWKKIGNTYKDYSVIWSKIEIEEVSSYAGKRVRFGFHLFGDSQGNSCGWYADDVTFHCLAPEITMLLSPPNHTTGPANDTFYWHSSFRATSYRIQIAYDSLFASLSYDLSNILDTTYYITELDTTIWWRVRGENVCDYGPWSNKWAYTDVEEPNDLQNNVPGDFALQQNYPNPFNPQTRIEYSLPKEGEVKIIIYNLLGQRVKTLIDEQQTAGHKEILWDGKGDNGTEVASGIYFYRIKAGDFIQSRKMVLMK